MLRVRQVFQKSDIGSLAIATAAASGLPVRRRMLIDTNRMPLALGPAEGEALWCAGALTTVKAAGEQTDGAYSIIEDLAPKDSGTPLHRHQEDDEAFYVLAGEMVLSGK